MRRVARALFVLLGSGAACNGEASTTAAAPATANACGPAEVEELRTLLVGTCTEPGLFDTRTLAIAPWEPTGASEADGIPIHLTTAGVGIGFDPQPSEPESFPTHLRVELEQARARARALDEPFEPRFVLAIRPDVPLAMVDGVVRTLAAEKLDRGVLVFASGTRPRASPARHPELYARHVAELEATDPSERARFMALQIEPYAQRCAGLQRSFENVATLPATSRCERLMPDVAQALVDCGCPEWQPELVSWLQVMVGPADAPHLHVEPVALAPIDPRPAKRTATWAELVASQRAAIGTLWLELAE